MRSCTWVGWSHGIWRFVPPAGVDGRVVGWSGVNPVSPDQPSVGHCGLPNKHGGPREDFLMTSEHGSPDQMRSFKKVWDEQISDSKHTSEFFAMNTCLMIHWWAGFGGKSSNIGIDTKASYFWDQSDYKWEAVTSAHRWTVKSPEYDQERSLVDFCKIMI